MQVDEMLHQMVREVTETSSYLDEFLDTILKAKGTLPPVVLTHLAATLSLIETNMTLNDLHINVHLTRAERQASELLDDAYRIQTTIIKRLLKFPPTP